MQTRDENLYVSRATIVNTRARECLNIHHDELALEIISGNGDEVIQLPVGITVGEKVECSNQECLECLAKLTEFVSINPAPAVPRVSVTTTSPSRQYYFDL
jgi:hypothetical protein